MRSPASGFAMVRARYSASLLPRLTDTGGMLRGRRATASIGPRIGHRVLR